MAGSKRFLKATWLMMEALLETENMEEALAKSLDSIIDNLGSEAGIIWIIDKKSKRLKPVYHTGAIDVSDTTIDNNDNIEATVIKTSKSIMITDASKDDRFDFSIFSDNGLDVKTMICAPLNNTKEVIGCVQIINKKDGSRYDNEELVLCEHMAALAAMTIEEKGLAQEEEVQKEVLVSLRGITKDFKSGDNVIHVLKGIDLDIYKNEFIVILGESGCGKSTMMNIVGGMDFMTEGALTVEGKDFSKPTDEELTKFRRNQIGYIFQSYNLMPNLSAIENVEFIAELVDDPMSCEEAIARVNMSERADNFPSQMSGGQQQRVSIARAIVKKPRLILADEPTAALDYATSIEVLETIEDIVKKYGTTVLMVTHNPEIAKMADRVVKMRNGRISVIKTNRNPLHAAELVW